MRIPLFIHVAAGVVLAGLVLRGVESNRFSFSLPSLANFLNKPALNRVPETTEFSTYKPLSLQPTSIKPAREAPYQGSWHNDVVTCQVNTKTKDEHCEMK